MKLLLVIVFLSMSWALPALSSEDGEAYDESFDFSFDEVSDWNDENNQSKSSKEKNDDTAPVKTNNNDTTNNDEIVAEDNGGEEFLPMRPQTDIPVATTAENENQPLPKSEKSLTDQLKKSAPQSQDKGIFDGTWVEKVTDFSPSKFLDDLSNKKSETKTDDASGENDDADLEKMMRSYRKKSSSGKSNAALFDISGVMLQMKTSQAEDILTNRGFKKVNARFQIPNFIKWRNEELCRAKGIVGYEQNQGCVIKMAQKGGFEYPQYMKFAKYETKEEIEIFMTSNFTDNKIYRIEYTSNIMGITGNSPKARYIRNLKIYDFWRRISQKYGSPDDKNRVFWGQGGNKPYLKAATGRLKLEDPMFVELDYTRMSMEDRRYHHSDFYNF